MSQAQTFWPDSPVYVKIYFMKKTIPALLLAFGVFGGCEKESPTKLPPCIRGKIEAEASSCCPNLKVIRYQTKSGHVYRFNRFRSADENNPVFDSECTELCSVGGFAGIEDCEINGVLFKLGGGKVVWE